MALLAVLVLTASLLGEFLQVLIVYKCFPKWATYFISLNNIGLACTIPYLLKYCEKDNYVSVEYYLVGVLVMVTHTTLLISY